MASAPLHIVKPLADDILARLSERDKLRARLAKVEREIAADVQIYSMQQGYRVTLRPEQARDEILRTRNG